MAVGIPEMARAVLEHEWVPDTSWSPRTAHTRHQYDGLCAVCRGEVERVLQVALASAAGERPRTELLNAAAAAASAASSEGWLALSERYAIAEAVLAITGTHELVAVARARHDALAEAARAIEEAGTEQLNRVGVIGYLRLTAERVLP